MTLASLYGLAANIAFCVQIGTGAIALSSKNGLGPLFAGAAALLAGGTEGGAPGAHASEAPLARHAAPHHAHAAHHLLPWELRSGVVEVSLFYILFTSHSIYLFRANPAHTFFF